MVVWLAYPCTTENKVAIEQGLVAASAHGYDVCGIYLKIYTSPLSNMHTYKLLSCLPPSPLTEMSCAHSKNETAH